jgi:hypothetical protein
MKPPRHSSYPMPIEDVEALAAEFSEFGYRETDDPIEADRRNYYKVDSCCTRATISAGPKRYSPAKRNGGPAAATSCGKASES